ncbi:MAG: enoyl-CoA hydratase-related protein [Chloroflexota bacterium]
MSDQPKILISQKEAIVRIQFNRPEKKNALNKEMYDAAREALIAADQNESVRVVYFTGSGDSFTAGNDLKDFRMPSSDDAASNMTSNEPSPASKFIKQISITETPIVAAVNGMAIGVGTTMLLHCDLVYAAPNAVFLMPFVDLGAVPEAASSYLLPQMVGQRRAAELLMLCERFDATTAAMLGIINDAVSADKLESYAWGKAEALANKPPQALRQTKLMLKRGNQQAVAETIPYEMELFGERLRSDEAQAVIQAMMSRKK